MGIFQTASEVDTPKHVLKKDESVSYYSEVSIYWYYITYIKDDKYIYIHIFISTFDNTNT
ncbi:hypothetical protein BOV97_13105 [Solemya velum gill symbiont]|nr:hypothetical protein BOV97_13105 [Solemya velum gill symbiont]